MDFTHHNVLAERMPEVKDLPYSQKLNIFHKGSLVGEDDCIVDMDLTLASLLSSAKAQIKGCKLIKRAIIPLFTATIIFLKIIPCFSLYYGML